MSDLYPKVYITEDVYLACMSLSYATNDTNYTAFIVGERELNGRDSYIVGLFLYISETEMKEMLNPKLCNATYENAEDGVGILGSLCNQSLCIVGWFHPHKHPLCSDVTSDDTKILNSLVEKEPTLFCLIASISGDSNQIHSSTMRVYRNKNKNMQPVSFTIIPSGRKVIFDKLFSLAQIFHMLKRREIGEWKKRNDEYFPFQEYFLHQLKTQKGLERYSYHIHRFVYPTFRILIQDQEIMKSLANFYFTTESKLLRFEEKKR